MTARDVTTALREAYDRRVDERDARPAPAWAVEEREAFRAVLQREGKRSVLELGAGTGSDALALLADRLDVVCTDLSPEMVRRCRLKGLTAHVMDVADLRFPAESFDAAYAMNCLVHVPKARLDDVLHGISRVLRPDALLYVGVHGGLDLEGIRDDDSYAPRRFYSHHRDEELQRIVTGVFDLLSFRQLPHGWNGLHFQSLVLRKRAPGPASTP